MGFSTEVHFCGTRDSVKKDLEERIKEPPTYLFNSKEPYFTKDDIIIAKGLVNQLLTDLNDYKSEKYFKTYKLLRSICDRIDEFYLIYFGIQLKCEDFVNLQEEETEDKLLGVKPIKSVRLKNTINFIYNKSVIYLKINTNAAEEYYRYLFDNFYRDCELKLSAIISDEDGKFDTMVYYHKEKFNNTRILNVYPEDVTHLSQY